MQKRSLSKKKLVEKNNAPSERPVNMGEVVTHRILSEELERRDYITKEFLSEELERRDYVTKPYLREEMTVQRKEYELYIGALAEDFQSKLDAITEIVVATAEDMTSIKDWIKEDHYNTHLTINTRLTVLESSPTSRS